MKYRYLKIAGDFVYGTNTITKEDLIRAKQNSYDAIINVETSQVFNPETNTWEDIQGDN